MRIYKTFKNIVFLSYFLFFFISCGENNKQIKAGSIDYNINWHKSKLSSMPTNMRLLYSTQGYCLELDKMFSFVGIRLSQNYKSDSLNFLLDMATIGTYVEFPLSNLHSNTKKAKVDKLTEFKNILNYKCKTILYTSYERSFRMKVYYAEKLNIDFINRILPELNINGAILGIEFIRKGQRIYAEATKISEQDVDSNLFIVPKDYINNSYEELLAIIDGLMK